MAVNTEEGDNKYTTTKHQQSGSSKKIVEKEMENTDSTEEVYQLYSSPCSLFQHLFNALFKCLGVGGDHQHYPKAQEFDTTSTSVAETELIITEEKYVMKSSTRAVRRPPRPPISSGGGGQIN